jgi:serine/threonine protein kinase
MIGMTLGHYRVVEKLGAGGMGVVYKALDTHLDRFVALKVLQPERVPDADRKRRFVQEAKAASALNHPNIIHVYDIAEADGIEFIAMEYVDGKALVELFGDTGLKLKDALKYATQIADALAKAHAAGIVHRDLEGEKGVRLELTPFPNGANLA